MAGTGAITTSHAQSPLCMASRMAGAVANMTATWRPRASAKASAQRATPVFGAPALSTVISPSAWLAAIAHTSCGSSTLAACHKNGGGRNWPPPEEVTPSDYVSVSLKNAIVRSQANSAAGAS